MLEDSGNMAVIIATDLMAAADALVKEIRRGIEEELSIPPAIVFVGAAQNHRTGGQVAPDVAARIVRAVKQDHATMVPARVGAGAGAKRRPNHHEPPTADEGRQALDDPPQHALAGLGRRGRAGTNGPADRPAAGRYGRRQATGAWSTTSPAIPTGACRTVR